MILIMKEVFFLIISTVFQVHRESFSTSNDFCCAEKSLRGVHWLNSSFVPKDNSFKLAEDRFNWLNHWVNSSLIKTYSLYHCESTIYQFEGRVRPTLFDSLANTFPVLLKVTFRPCNLENVNSFTNSWFLRKYFHDYRPWFSSDAYCSECLHCACKEP